MEEPHLEPRIVDKRGQNKRPEPESNGHVEMTEEEKLELLQAQAAADDSTGVDPEYRAVLTAFVVVLDHEGNVQASSELEILEGLSLARPATFSDMYSAAAHVMKDISGQETTHRVMMGLAQQAQAAQQAAVAQRIQGQMGLARR